MANNKIYVGIMAGGIGSRFWPKSRTRFPKQFIDILGTGSTLLQSTFDRFLNITPTENIYIITNQSYVGLVQEQLPSLPFENILSEPSRKNTAACVAYFSHKINAIDPDGLTILAPSDHLIVKENEFVDTMHLALNFAEQHDALLTLGILPTRPDTGYGYIQFHTQSEYAHINKVKTFTEKPNLDLAKTFMASGDFLWNSGIFAWSVRSVMNAFKAYQPEMHELFCTGKPHYHKSTEKDIIQRIYEQTANTSIDYAIMEKADNVYVIPSNFGWSDLGTWGSLYEHYNKDYWGNAVNGDNVTFYDSENNMVMVPDEKLVVLQGVNDCVVIDTGDVLLVCKKENEQMIKDITNDIKRQEKDKFL